MSPALPLLQRPWAQSLAPGAQVGLSCLTRADMQDRAQEGPGIGVTFCVGLLTSRRARAGLSSVPVSWERCNKSPQPAGLKPTGVCGLTVWEAWKSRCGWSWSLLDSLRASMPLSWLPGVVSNPWCSLDVNHTLQVSTVRSCSSWRQIYTEPTMWVDLLTSIYDVHYDVMS